MNQSKRAILHGALDVIIQIKRDEEQDLKDQPDSIEYSEACDDFRGNVADLNSAIVLLDTVINRNG